MEASPFEDTFLLEGSAVLSLISVWCLAISQFLLRLLKYCYSLSIVGLNTEEGLSAVYYLLDEYGLEATSFAFFIFNCHQFITK